MYRFADKPGGIKIAKVEKAVWSEIVWIRLNRMLQGNVGSKTYNQALFLTNYEDLKS